MPKEETPLTPEEIAQAQKDDSIRNRLISAITDKFNEFNNRPLDDLRTFLSSLTKAKIKTFLKSEVRASKGNHTKRKESEEESIILCDEIDTYIDSL